MYWLLLVSPPKCIEIHMPLSPASLTSDELEQILMSLDGIVDGAEPVDELSHALQCGHLSQIAGASRELVAAALFHDVGRSPLIACAYPNTPHEIVASTWLHPRLGAHVAWLAGAHVAAKMYLIETECGYANNLSEESRKSAAHQGSTSPNMFLEHAWWPEALQLRRWDDAAKDPDATLPSPRELLQVVRPLIIEDRIEHQS